MAAIEGIEPYHYQWQVSFRGSEQFTDAPDGDSSLPTYLTPLLDKDRDNESRYKVIVTDATGIWAVSEAALLLVHDGLAATTPADVVRNVGQMATFETSASGGTSPYHFHWQKKKRLDSDFTPIEGAQDLPMYTIPSLTSDDNGTQFRVAITDSKDDRINSSYATLTVHEKLAVTKPQSQVKNEGQSVLFEVEAQRGTGTAPYQHQWQVSRDGKEFNNIDGANAPVYAIYPLTINLHDGTYYRAVISDATPIDSVVSELVTLKVNEKLTTSAPGTVTLDEGQTATFSTTAAKGTGSYRYQWQKQAKSETKFSNVLNAVQFTYKTPMLDKASDDGSQYRVVVTDEADDSVRSVVAQLTVNAKLETSKPDDQTKNEEQKATFKTTINEGKGTPEYYYQWQVSKDGTSFTDIAVDAKGPSYTTDKLKKTSDDGKGNVRL